MKHSVYKYLCLSFLLSGAVANAQTPDKVEYFWDKDPGHGKGTIVAATTGENSLRINFDNVDYGVHTLWFRSQDSKGNWSSTIGKPILIKKDAASTITKMEYFWDIDPGYDKASAITAVAVGEKGYAINTAEIDNGAHLFCVRAKDNMNQWSTVISKPIYVYTINGLVTAMEYFIDNDPGEGCGTMVDITGENQVNATFTIDIDSLSLGDHQLNVRIKDCYGKWSLLSSEPFEIVESGGIENAIFTMPITVKAENGVCTLLSEQLRTDDYNVTIIGVDGRMIAKAVWDKSSSACDIHIGVTKHPIIVIAESSESRWIKRIIAK
ncbi:MAG: hypothetical protein E7081_00710 [Bacteroidales bacterium]|nr:hypothetical protein [Bacteroidales bacterium]